MERDTINLTPICAKTFADMAGIKLPQARFLMKRGYIDCVGGPYKDRCANFVFLVDVQTLVNTRDGQATIVEGCREFHRINNGG